VRGPGRVISVASAAITVGAQADTIVEGNDIGYQGDDSIALSSVTGTITGVQGAKVDVPVVCTPDPMDEPVAGDTLAFFDENYVYLASARVASASGTFCGTTLSLTLDHAVPGLTTTGNFLDLTQQASARYLIRNNVMHECRCHGIYVNAPYGSITNNVMYNNSEGNVQLAGGNGVGPGSTNLAITANLMSSPGQSAQYYGALISLATDVNGNILTAPSFDKLNISNNIFANAPGPAMVIASVRDFSLDQNWLIDTNQNQTTPLDFGNLTSLDSILVFQSSNGTVCGTTKAGSTTGPIGIDSTSQQVVNNPACN
jgi:hypothetical protein